MFNLTVHNFTTYYFLLNKCEVLFLQKNVAVYFLCASGSQTEKKDQLFHNFKN
jgi:hypothetical protein